MFSKLQTSSPSSDSAADRYTTGPIPGGGFKGGVSDMLACLCSTLGASGESSKCRRRGKCLGGVSTPAWCLDFFSGARSTATCCNTPAWLIS